MKMIRQYNATDSSNYNSTERSNQPQNSREMLNYEHYEIDQNTMIAKTINSNHD
jgi:predicted double-glycine peptidase